MNTHGKQPSPPGDPRSPDKRNPAPAKKKVKVLKRKGPSRFKPVQQMVTERVRKWRNKPSKLVVKSRRYMILEQYSQGKTPEQIAVALKMRAADVTRDLNIAIDEMVQLYASPSPQQTFVRYASFQLAIIRKLNDAITSFRSDPQTRQYNSWVSALKTQSDIYDKIMTKGVSFGVIEEKRADPRSLGPQVDLLAELTAEITSLESLKEKVGKQSRREEFQAKLNLSPKAAIRLSSRYTVRVRVPIKDAYGILRAIPDWKYRKVLSGPDGSPLPTEVATQIAPYKFPRILPTLPDDMEMTGQEVAEKLQEEAPEKGYLIAPIKDK